MALKASLEVYSRQSSVNQGITPSLIWTLRPTLLLRPTWFHHSPARSPSTQTLETPTPRPLKPSTACPTACPNWWTLAMPLLSSTHPGLSYKSSGRCQKISPMVHELLDRPLSTSAQTSSINLEVNIVTAKDESSWLLEDGDVVIKTSSFEAYPFADSTTFGSVIEFNLNQDGQVLKPSPPLTTT